MVKRTAKTKTKTRAKTKRAIETRCTTKRRNLFQLAKKPKHIIIPTTHYGTVHAQRVNMSPCIWRRGMSTDISDIDVSMNMDEMKVCLVIYSTVKFPIIITTKKHKHIINMDVAAKAYYDNSITDHCLYRTYCSVIRRIKGGDYHIIREIDSIYKAA